MQDCGRTYLYHGCGGNQQYCQNRRERYDWSRSQWSKTGSGLLCIHNFWGFPAKEGHDPAFLTVLEDGFKDFFEKDVPANPQKAEYLRPTLIGGLLRDGKCTVKVLETKDNWFGVTYNANFAYELH